MGVSEKSIKKLKTDIGIKETEEKKSFLKRWSGLILLLFFFLGIGYFWGNKAYASFLSKNGNFAANSGKYLQFNANELSWGKVSVLLDDHPGTGIIISYGSGIPKDTIFHSGGYTKLVMAGKPLFLKSEKKKSKSLASNTPTEEDQIVENILAKAVRVNNDDPILRAKAIKANYSVPGEYNAPSPIKQVEISNEEIKPLGMGSGEITFKGNAQENSPIYFHFSDMKTSRKYKINFGDDTGLHDFHNNKFHAYEKPGIYTVKLHENSGNHEYVYRKKVSVYSEPTTWLKAAGAIKNSGIKEVVRSDDKIASTSSKKASSIPSKYKLSAQRKVNKEVKKSAKSLIPTNVEVMPSFPGGTNALSKFIKENLVYPEIAKEFGKKGKVQVQFVVEETGVISNVKVVNGIGYGCDEAAVKLVSAMPNWSPGIDKGERTKVVYVLPIEFK